MLPLVQIIFVSSNTDPLFTHEASVTQLCPAWVVTGLEVGQRLGGDTIEAIRQPGATLGATYTIVPFACVCMINTYNFEYNDLVTWALWPSWLACRTQNRMQFIESFSVFPYQECLSRLLWTQGSCTGHQNGTLLWHQCSCSCRRRVLGWWNPGSHMWQIFHSSTFGWRIHRKSQHSLHYTLHSPNRILWDQDTDIVLDVNSQFRSKEKCQNFKWSISVHAQIRPFRSSRFHQTFRDQNLRM